MFVSRNKKNNVYPCKPKFYYIKVGFKGVEIIKVCFRDVSQLIRFARVSNRLIDFNARNKTLTAKLLQQGYRYQKIRKAFS